MSGHASHGLIGNTDAAGQLGRRVAARLAARGIAQRLVTHDGAPVASLPGSAVVVVDEDDDGTALQKALAGVDTLFSRASERPVVYVEETVEEAKESRALLGAPEWQLDAWVTTYLQIARGELDVVTDAVPRLTGHPALTLSEFLAAHPPSFAHVTGSAARDAERVARQGVGRAVGVAARPGPSAGGPTGGGRRTKVWTRETGGRHHRGVDEHEVREWFGAYLSDFVALGRGDSDDVRRLLLHYGVPFLISTDAGTTALTDEAQVLAMARQQVDGMRVAGYDRTEELHAETVVLNGSCAGHRARFARLRADGSEISQLEVTYLITDRPEGRRISALVVHSAA